MERIIKAYLDPKTGFKSVKELARQLKLKPAQVKEALETLPEYQRTKPRKKIKPARVISDHRNQKHQTDLIQMDKAPFKGQSPYLLTYIDVFTRYATAIPISDKKPESIILALSVIHSTAPFGIPFKPEILESDMGGEFANELVKKYCEDNNIELRITMNAPNVEAFNKTFEVKLSKALRMLPKTKLWGELKKLDKANWIGLLPSIIGNYNTSRHRVIKTEPATAYRTGITKETFTAQKDKKRFNVGDRVRVQLDKNPRYSALTRAYFDKWTDKAYTIGSIRKTKDGVHLYYLVDLSDGTWSKHGFYEGELSKA